MEPDQNNCLFVYGTLISTDRGELGRDMRARLQQEAKSLGAARITGRLYDLGDYPGIIASANPDEQVWGEVYQLTHPHLSLLWLDEYEGVGDGNEIDDVEYERVLRPVTLAASNSIIDAWVYLWLLPVEERQLVPHGRWSERTRRT